MKDIYAGEFVRLSAIDVDEFAKSLVRWNRDSEFVRFLNSGIARVLSEKKEKEWIEKVMDEQNVNSHFFAIRSLADDGLLGLIDLFVDSWPARNTYVGIGIGEREFWGKGYGTDAMNAILRYAFVELNMNRVTLIVFDYNPRAIRSYEKVGFRHEGRIRSYLNKEGKRWDMLSMGVLREEWKGLDTVTMVE